MCKITLYELTDGDLTDNGLSQVLVDTYLDRTKEFILTDGYKKKARFLVLQEARPQPEWFRYIKPILADDTASIKSTVSLGGLLLIKPDTDSHFYAAAWGSARFLLRQEKINPNLGIYCALNLLCGNGDAWDPECIRKITSKRIDANTLNSQFQFAKLASFESFPFTLHTDQLRSITGTPIESAKWGTISGGVGINFRGPEAASGIIDICLEIEVIRAREDYREHFSFVDEIKPVFEDSILQVLKRLFADQVTSGNTGSFFISPPEILDWADISSFRYIYHSNTQPAVEKTFDVEEPDLDSTLAFLHTPEISPELREVLFSDALNLQALDNNGHPVETWPIYFWLGCELEMKDSAGTTVKHYVLDAGDFYIIDRNYMDELNKFVAETEITDAVELDEYQVMPAEVKVQPAWVTSPPNKEYPEDNYVNAMVNRNNTHSLRLHKRLVSDKAKVDGITTPIEICDLAMENPRRLVHLKVGTGSSDLSHLFSQAAVSAELLEMNPTFRKKTHEIVDNGKVEDHTPATPPDSFAWLYNEPIDTHAVTVVMGMITDKVKPLAEALPFFSKVNFRRICQNLGRMGYQFKMVKIPYVKIG